MTLVTVPSTSLITAATASDDASADAHYTTGHATAVGATDEPTPAFEEPPLSRQRRETEELLLAVNSSVLLRILFDVSLSAEDLARLEPRTSFGSFLLSDLWCGARHTWERLSFQRVRVFPAEGFSSLPSRPSPVPFSPAPSLPSAFLPVRPPRVPRQLMCGFFRRAAHLTPHPRLSLSEAAAHDASSSPCASACRLSTVPPHPSAFPLVSLPPTCAPTAHVWVLLPPRASVSAPAPLARHTTAASSSPCAFPCLSPFLPVSSPSHQLVCGFFRRPAHLTPHPRLSLAEVAAHDHCQQHSLRFRMLPRAQQRLLWARCGLSWKLLLRFLITSDACIRHGQPQVAAGCMHSVAVGRGGEVWTFGHGSAGQLGRPLASATSAAGSAGGAAAGGATGVFGAGGVGGFAAVAAAGGVGGFAGLANDVTATGAVTVTLRSGIERGLVGSGDASVEPSWKPQIVR
ncbi:unnamed protein product [Closterium sp. NIES-53]